MKNNAISSALRLGTPSRRWAEGGNKGDLMGLQQRWQSEPTGMISAERAGFRLIIHRPAAEGFVRFLVIDNRQAGKHPQALVASGTEEDVTSAKAAAERMAARLTS
ncbi:hypothetical protein [Limobrevibacterium gyesilva]|uniref:Uncharacterized protein n=1 Tax=Limobrevibacterium gyesilva TaxID=2991712 RepID=A0AA41YQJ1_9PROT|nr:hypothetical protein [Limobrevibacterium gyesilva]MCW3476737.1 hypothetical protein [Limobrevibacterium gyesilva]